VSDQDDEFFEEDEPVEEVREAFDRGVKGVTAPHEMVQIPLHTLQWLLIGLREGAIAESTYAVRDMGEYEILRRTVVEAGGFDPLPTGQP
jgi:hypothetical protein